MTPESRDRDQRPSDGRRTGRGPPLPGPDEGQRAIAEAAVQAGCDAYFGYRSRPRPNFSSGWPAACSSWDVFSSRRRASSAPSIWHSAGRDRSQGHGLVLESGYQPHGRGHELHGRLGNADGARQHHAGRPGSGSIGPSQSDYFQAPRATGTATTAFRSWHRRRSARLRS